ncbi:methylase of polypeptide subunit release factors [Marmoricola sp. OAE513]|uniref:methyltransferase n=1 Tax=Marmoricola sp. OAE513 TaxID=2817894 RepID=UPI001AE46B45
MTTLETVVVTARRGVRIVQFGPLRISYDQRVLEPRPWTALQSRWANQLIGTAAPGPVLELCSGAGQIGLLAVHGTDRRLVAVDANPVASAFHRINARAAGLEDQVEVRTSYLTDACAEDELFPMILADPPWVLRSQVDRFPDDPVRAIDGGEDGLDVARQCIDVINRHLDDDGVALVQVGDGPQVQQLADALPYGLVATEHRAEPGRGAVVKVVATEPRQRRLTGRGSGARG